MVTGGDYQLGDTVYGVHSEVSNNKFYVGVTEEKIIELREYGGWVSRGQYRGSVVDSYCLNAFDTYEEAAQQAEEIASEACVVAEVLGDQGVWKEVVRDWQSQ